MAAQHAGYLQLLTHTHAFDSLNWFLIGHLRIKYQVRYFTPHGASYLLPESLIRETLVLTELCPLLQNESCVAVGEF
ncbi:MAG: hypothetical protein ABW185_25110 [Sedimenticola sp.]